MYNRRTGAFTYSLMAVTKVGGLDNPVWTLPSSDTATRGARLADSE